MDSKREVTALELAMSTSYQLEAIVRVLERKGLMTREELIQEIKLIAAEQRAGERPS